MVKAVIFDQDGVIFDNEPLVSKSYEILLKTYGKEPILEKHGLLQSPGLRGDEIWKLFEKKYDIHEDHQLLRQKRREIHLELLKGKLVPMPGLINLLKLLKKHGIKLAVATGSTANIVGAILNNLKIREYFTVVVTGEDFLNSKPDPEAFLIASQRLRINPEESIVIEDSEVGVVAANKANMKVIAVPTIHSNHGDFTMANLVVTSLKNITWNTLTDL